MLIIQNKCSNCYILNKYIELLHYGPTDLKGDDCFSFLALQVREEKVKDGCSQSGQRVAHKSSTKILKIHKNLQSIF